MTLPKGELGVQICLDFCGISHELLDAFPSVMQKNKPEFFVRRQTENRIHPEDQEAQHVVLREYHTSNEKRKERPKHAQEALREIPAKEKTLSRREERKKERKKNQCQG
jgi:hypothetical protein